MSYQAAEWAVTAPMPTSDPAARAVLAYLAVKSDRHGRNAYPLAISMAFDLGLNPEVVGRVLKRLVGYGLIAKDGIGPQGQPRWSLNMDRIHPEGAFEAFCVRHRATRAGRQSRWRSNTLVDDPQSSTRPDVDDSKSSRRRSAVVSKTIESRHVDDSECPQISPEISPDQPGISPSAASPLTDAFDRFWSIYPRRVGRKAAKAKFATALKATDAEVIIAGAQRYADSRKGSDPKFTAHPTTWLNAGRWDDEPEPAHRNGHQPYQNPTDDDAYYSGSLLGA